MSDPDITQQAARALVEAGYMPLEEYLRLCRDMGWTADVPDDPELPAEEK